KGTGGRPGIKYLKNGLYKPGPKLNDIKKQAEVEKKARDAAVAESRKREEAKARQVAESKSEKGGASSSEVKRAGDLAVANVAKDEVVQKKIKDSGDKAAAQATKEAVKSKEIETPAKSVEFLAKDSSEVVGTAKSRQRAIEEKPHREEAIEKQRKIEEQN